MGKKMNLETKSFAAAISFALCCSSLSATAANTAFAAFSASAASSTSVASSESSKNVELSAALPAQHYQPTKETCRRDRNFRTTSSESFCIGGCTVCWQRANGR